nr:adenylate/guanylate cyclase domain-containing protein [Streptomyces sp. DSM 41633]
MRRFGVTIDVRVGVHRGVVYLDTAQDDVYGFAANLAARISSLAAPGTVAVSDAVAALIGGTFELAACPAAPVKGVDEPVNHHQVLSDYPTAATTRTPALVGRHRERDWLESAWQQAEDGTLTCPG